MAIEGGKLVDTATRNSVFELLYQICCARDQHAIDRITMMLNWLVDVANVSMQVIIELLTVHYCFSPKNLYFDFITR